MSSTIAGIVTDFLTIHERVIVYVCDDSDSRADARRKLFDSWIRQHKGLLFIKTDIPLGMDEQGNEYSAEFVARLDNPYIAAVLDSFRRTVLGIK